MAGTNTGNGGFEIDGKVYEFDVGDPSAPGEEPTNPDPGDLTVDKSVKDLSKKTKTTLAKYLSDLTLGKEGDTKGVPNKFPVDAPDSPVVTEIDVSDTSGNPVPIAPTINSSHFADPDPINPYSTHYPIVASDLKKGKRTAPGTDGNDLLRGVTKNAPGPVIDEYRNDVTKGNRFTDAKEAVPLPVDPLSPPKKFHLDLETEEDLEKGVSPGATPKTRSFHDEVKHSSDLTSTNEFPVDAPAQTPELSSTSDSHNNPAPLAGTTNKAHFADPTPINPYSSHNAVLHTGKNTDLKKGKATTPGVDGNKLLPGVTKDTLGKPLQEYHDDTVSGNRFTDAKEAVPSPTDPLAPPASFFYPVESSEGLEKGVSPGPNPKTLTFNDETRRAGAVTKDNAFGVDSKSNVVSTTTHDGVPQPLSDTSNSEHFVERDNINLKFTSTPQLRLNTRFHGDNINDPVQNLKFSKGKTSQTSPPSDDGNSLLEFGNQVPDRGTVQSYVSAVLKNNRFTEAARSAAVDIEHPGDYQTVLHHPKYGGNAGISQARLAQVGVALSIRASQELGATEGNPSNGAQLANSLLPGYNQLGAERINTRVLEARDVLESLTEDEQSNVISIAPNGSWGALNNVEDQFSGITALGMIVLSVALTIAVFLAFEILGTLLGFLKSPTGKGATKAVSNRYALGRFIVPKTSATPGFSLIPPDLGALLGLNPTTFPFKSAVDAGLSSFFGLQGDLTSALLGLATSSTENPGFNAIVARAIIRSSLTIIDAFKNISFSNVLSGINSILNIVDTIRSSKLIAAMNVFAMLGDQLLLDDAMGETVDDDVISGETTKKSRMDQLPDDSGAVQKNRLRGSIKLAWSSNRSPSSYLLPSSLFGLSLLGGRLGGFRTGIEMQNEKARNFFKLLSLSDQAQGGARIPYDDAGNEQGVTVKALEDMLEAEYMPFYLHDLRTNEIISFHAFITALTDDYTANWEQSEGYGRVDPVRVYKSTNRKISVGFYVVSTIEEDFNDMWLKINKLVTMVYPQYTKGRLLTDQDGKNVFTQPFSQLISASPLVRLRLGDLFRSNYSRFALARLFGADSGDMKLDSIPQDYSQVVSDVQLFQTALTLELLAPKGEFFLNTAKLPKSQDKGGGGISLPMPPGISSAGDKPKFAETFDVLPSDFQYFIFDVKEDRGNGQVTVVPKLLSLEQMHEFYGISPSAAANTIKRLESEYKNGDKPAKRVLGGGKDAVTYVAPKQALQVPPDRVKKIFQQQLATEIRDVETLADFMDPEKNALVKSFKAVQGKGLAGTIDSLNFDWYDRVNWDIAPGRRAPQFCRVTLGFTPIHDVSPGIDHAGYNRAPVYPVGHYVHGTDNYKQGK